MPANCRLAASCSTKARDEQAAFGMLSTMLASIAGGMPIKKL
jgi:hypothetical protein